MALSLRMIVSLLLLTACPSVLASSAPRVKLDYATYEGTALSNGINQFLGMRYAAPPIDDNRFKKPLPPAHEKSLVRATNHGPICHSVQGLRISPPPIEQQEDCLFIDVYTPANATDDQNPGMLPVMLWIQGGRFVMNFNPNFNGTGLIEASNGEVIVVTFNYRVGPFGFLSSEELEEEGNLNVGLHDQRAAIRWVRKYITKFGGDPDKLTLFGTCAGGASILAHAMAWGGKPPTPNDAAWAGGIAQSLYLPPIHHVDERDYLYNELLAATGCSDLVCLRALPCYKIQEANVARPLSDLGTYPLFPYTPVIDKDFFMDEPLTALRKGMFDQGLPLIVGGVTTPGTIFVPQVETEADIQKFLSTEFRHLSRGDIQDIVEQYSDVPSTYPGVTAKVSSRFFELAKTFGDTAIKCPSIMFADALSRVGAPAYLYSYNVTDSVELAAGYIVPHTWELEAVWDPRYAKNYVALQGANSYWPGGRNHPMIHQIQQYWLSFVRTLGNPNRGASVTWNPYANGSELVLQTNKTRMTQIATEQFEACKLWEKLAEEINS